MRKSLREDEAAIIGADRLTEPLLRKDGKLTEISMDEAISIVVAHRERTNCRQCHVRLQTTVGSFVAEKEPPADRR